MDSLPLNACAKGELRSPFRQKWFGDQWRTWHSVRGRTIHMLRDGETPLTHSEIEQKIKLKLVPSQIRALCSCAAVISSPHWWHGPRNDTGCST
jgi:hypothetical protein